MWKPRREARTILLAWLLLMPPVKLDGTVNPAAPLSQWQILLRFGSQSDCESSRWDSQGPRDPFTARKSGDSGAFGANLRCVASGDRRLKQ